MAKDFDTWNNQKKELDQSKGDIFFKEREIWWVGLGLNIGYEQDGKGSQFGRPVLILKKFNQYIALAIPLTTVKKDNKYYVECISDDEGFRMAIISQVRLIDVKRLLRKITMVHEKSFQKIKAVIKDML